ncbi:unnamed protein product, partial [Rotaria sordida]
NDDNSIPSIDSSSVNPTNFNPSSSPIELRINSSTNDDTNDHVLNEVPVKQGINLFFLDEDIIPTLPNSLFPDIETGALHKFGPHHTNRQILIDIIIHDLVEKYHLFYPTHKQFDNIGSAIVRQLKLPLTKDNIILLMNYDDDILNNIQMKVNQLRDDPDIDVNARVQLWKETIHVRRKNIREWTTSEIVEEFSRYADPILIFEEVKMTMGIDLRAIVRKQIPVLLDKMVTTPAVITDKLNPSCFSTIEDKNNSTGDNSNIDTVIIYNEINDKAEETSSSHADCPKQTIDS